MDTVRKTLMLILTMVFVSGVSAVSVIDFTKHDSSTSLGYDYDWIVVSANNYAVTSCIASKYESILVSYTEGENTVHAVLKFSDNKLVSIEETQEPSGVDVDTSININRENVEHLLKNYKTMGLFDRLEYAFDMKIPVWDVLKFGSCLNKLEA